MRCTNSIFEEAWWLDAVAPGRWTALEVRNGDEIVARWPLTYTKLLGFKIIKNPRYTQTLGPWMKIEATNYIKYLSQKKKYLEQLIGMLPKKPRNMIVTLDSSNEYILPFRWRGFEYTPLFSYRFSDLTDLEAIYRGIDSKQKTVIKKASESLEIVEDCSIDVLISMIRKTNERQNRDKLDVEQIRRIDAACTEHNARKLLVAKDSEGNVHAAVYLVYDERVCYYLFGGADPKFRSSGAQSLLLWNAIKFASTVSGAFDFEGSNVELIERNFRSFGSGFVVNYQVRRLNLLLRLLYSL